jgi:hypothetical protein
MRLTFQAIVKTSKMEWPFGIAVSIHIFMKISKSKEIKIVLLVFFYEKESLVQFFPEEDQQTKILISFPKSLICILSIDINKHLEN